MAAITGSIAKAFYKQIPEPIKSQAIQRLPVEFVEIFEQVSEKSK